MRESKAGGRLYNSPVASTPANLESPAAAGQPPNSGHWWGLLGLTLVVRLAAWWGLGDAFRDDPDAYRQLAVEFSATGVFGYAGQSVAFRPPLYPLCLAAGTLVEALPSVTVGLWHLAWGLATVILVARWAEPWVGRGWARWAGALVAIDPILLRQSTLVMTETLAAMLAAVLVTLAVAVGQATHHRLHLCAAAAAGLSLGAALLCRPTFLPAGVLCGLWCLLPGRGARPAWRVVLVWLATAALVLAPWTIRNWIMLGRPVWLTSHGGYTLLLANNRHFYDHVLGPERYLPWDSTTFEAEQRFRHPDLDGQGQLAYDRQAYAQAWEVIRHAPRKFFRVSLYRLGRFWACLPLRTTEVVSRDADRARLAVGAFYLAEHLAALWAAWAYRRRLTEGPWPAALILVLSFSAVHTLFWSDMRMRAPLVPVIAWAAILGVNDLLARFSFGRNHLK